jgi:5-bromo-4-chloroindolyl phosphate hydrolysis protein
MIDDPQEQREIRAARRQSRGREVNETVVEMKAAGTLVVVCECADDTCGDTFEITPRDYEVVRHQPTHFAVRPGHVYPEVERVVAEHEAYVVVEKVRKAAEVAAQADPRRAFLSAEDADAQLDAPA